MSNAKPGGMAHCIERATARPGVGPGRGSSAIPLGGGSQPLLLLAPMSPERTNFRCADAARRDTSARVGSTLIGGICCKICRQLFSYQPRLCSRAFLSCVNEVGWSGGLDLSPPGGAASIDFAVTRANEHKLSQANAARRGPARRFPCRREKFGEVRLSVAWERIEECNSSGQGGSALYGTPIK
jgi:hypothetical protein